MLVNVITDEVFNQRPHFVKLRGDTWVHCGDADAQAIALHAKLYRILGNAGDIFYIEPFERRDLLRALAHNNDDLHGALFELDAQRQDITDALFELDQRLEALENG